MVALSELGAVLVLNVESGKLRERDALRLTSAQIQAPSELCWS